MRGASFHTIKPTVSQTRAKLKSKSLNRTSTRERYEHPTLSPKMKEFTPLLHPN